MEQVFVDVCTAIDVFLERFGPGKYNNGVCHSDKDAGCEDASNAKGSLKPLVDFTTDSDIFVLHTEALHKSIHAVGRESRWLSGCRCHGWIWEG